MKNYRKRCRPRKAWNEKINHKSIGQMKEEKQLKWFDQLHRMAPERITKKIEEPRWYGNRKLRRARKIMEDIIKEIAQKIEKNYNTYRIKWIYREKEESNIIMKKCIRHLRF
ncbi:unnamed protein product [Psylliodes chrysocephalus]|uniref:Uncharacterized protein n=1 Tax=Psylliodes chrysocephalus TaxID=3402493 RepID=A0A9P0G4M4_9CUCU|nr:unnamed protein product [Psylliodes chrysocephala]